MSSLDDVLKDLTANEQAPPATQPQDRGILPDHSNMYHRLFPDVSPIITHRPLGGREIASFYPPAPKFHPEPHEQEAEVRRQIMEANS